MAIIARLVHTSRLQDCIRSRSQFYTIPPIRRVAMRFLLEQQNITNRILTCGLLRVGRLRRSVQNSRYNIIVRT